MARWLLLITSFIGLYIGEIDAQHDTLRIRPEVLKAIREGTFLNLDQPRKKLQEADPSLPITKDFSEYIQPDELPSVTNQAQIPPSVFLLKQIRRKESRLKIQEQAFHIDKRQLKPKGILIPHTNLRVETGAANLFSPEVKDGQRHGTIHATVSGTFSLDELLQLIFWQSARDKKRNKKRENTWKYYNDYPTY